jgi:general secretion pathway protein L
VAEPAVAALAEQLFERSVTLQSPAARRLLALQSGWDLAQFDLAQAGRWRQRSWQLVRTWATAPHWRTARWAVGVLLVGNLLGLELLAWQAQAHNAAQRLAMQRLLTRTFDQVQLVVDAPLQMARELALLQQASGAPSGADFETMLQVLAANLSSASAPATLDYDAGQLRVGGIHLSAAALATLDGQLQTQGYTLRLEDGQLLMQARH